MKKTVFMTPAVHAVETKYISFRLILVLVLLGTIDLIFICISVQSFIYLTEWKHGLNKHHKIENNDKQRSWFLNMRFFNFMTF